MRLLPACVAIWLACAVVPSFAQTPVIQRASSTVKLDGQLDEPCWQTAEVLADFTRNFPVDTGLARTRTEVRLAFDQKNLYVGIVCWQNRASYTVQSLKRDFGPGTSDVVNVVIDPFKDGLNGFLFGVSPLNVQREALVDNGTNLSYEWDNRWYSEVQNFDDRWVVEMAIPFKTLRYKVADGANVWRFNFVRTGLNPWEVSAWNPVPFQYVPNGLAFARDIAWAEAPPKQSTAIALIPYATSRVDANFRRDPNTLERNGTTTEVKPGFGGDAKIGITPSLNLDLTVNPDFSQVEVDRQQANLSRFELFFPERRQFFLENRDLFATFGFPSTRPFFSRRIGLAYNPVTEQYQSVPILAGARLNGKVNDNWRVGLLNMQTKRVDWDSTRTSPAANFTVATVQRKVLKRSAISAIYVDKANALKNLNDTQRADFQPWNRVAGAEFNLYSQDNRWEGEWYYHRSFSPDKTQQGASMAQFLGYQGRHFTGRLGIQRTDTAYTAEAGFVPRPGVQGIYSGASWQWYPKRSYLTSLRVFVDNDQTTDLHFRETDRDLFGGWSASGRDQAQYTVGVYNSFTRLFEPFDPSNDDATPLPAGTYEYWGLGGEYASSSSYNLQGSLNWAVGQYYNGTGANLNGELTYRWQPYGTFGLLYSYNRIRLPKPYANADILLLGPSAALSFSRTLFASAFFQYNTQANNFNINARLQWRFAPVSDLFLVYTDNSYATSVRDTPVRFFSPKNKAVVLKVVYWLNV